MKKKLALIHTVNWYDKSVIEPFAKRWAEKYPEVEIINIMDDSLLTESVRNEGATPQVFRRMLFYFMAAEAAGADVIMSTCTSMGAATRQFRSIINVPVFNIDEPMASEAIKSGTKLGIFATVPTSVPATKFLLESEARRQGKEITIETVLNPKAFEHLLKGETSIHDQIVLEEIGKLAKNVEAVVLGQISLSKVKPVINVPVLQVGDLGFKEASRLLGLV
jgi:aspartate/glutamate racemase